MLTVRLVIITSFISIFFSNIGLTANDPQISRRNFGFLCSTSFLLSNNSSIESTPDLKNLPLQAIGIKFRNTLIDDYGMNSTEAEMHRIRLQEIIWNQIIQKVDYRTFTWQKEKKVDVTFDNLTTHIELPVDLSNGEKLLFQSNISWSIIAKYDEKPEPQIIELRVNHLTVPLVTLDNTITVKLAFEN